jgi:hypothetical protein
LLLRRDRRGACHEQVGGHDDARDDDDGGFQHLSLSLEV